jgi:hypothetical protein
VRRLRGDVATAAACLGGSSDRVASGDCIDGDASVGDVTPPVCTTGTPPPRRSTGTGDAVAAKGLAADTGDDAEYSDAAASGEAAVALRLPRPDGDVCVRTDVERDGDTSIGREASPSPLAE